MNVINEIPPPVLFNRWKHHLGFISNSVKELASSGRPDYTALGNTLKVIGNSQADLYTGGITDSEVASCAVQYINELGIYEISSYIRWLHSEGKRYRIIGLPDGSKWTLLEGNSSERFLHIHPSRYSPYSMRVKAVTLKTAISAIYLAAIEMAGADSKEIINRARKEILNECPVKSAENSSALIKLIKLLTINRI